MERIEGKVECPQEQQNTSTNKTIAQNPNSYRSSDHLFKQSANRSAVRLHHLEVSQFIGSPYSIIVEIRRCLHPKDLLSLARALRRTRCFFMSKRSRPCWDVSRSNIGIPEWSEVAAPRVVSFLFHTFCQEQGCSNRSSMRCFIICRSLCGPCASVKLFTKVEVGARWPALPYPFVKKLPWTHQ